MNEDRKIKPGMIIDPIAGIGGRVGLKGSDGTDIVQRALNKGARPEAPARTMEALFFLKRINAKIEVVTYPGEIGADICRKAGWKPEVIRSVGKENINVAATQEKLLGLNGNPLLVDTGDEYLNRELCGYIEVVTDLDTVAIYRISIL